MANYARVPDTYKGKDTNKMTRNEYERMLKELGYDQPSKEKHGYVGEEPDTAPAKPKKMMKGGSVKAKKMAIGGLNTMKARPAPVKSAALTKAKTTPQKAQAVNKTFVGGSFPAENVLPGPASVSAIPKKMAKGGDAKAFKPCKGCPNAAKCKAAGKCLAKKAAKGMLVIPVNVEKSTATKYAGAKKKKAKK